MNTYGLKVENYSSDIGDLAEMRRIGREILILTDGRPSIKRDLAGLNHGLTKTASAGKKYFASIVAGYYKFMAMQLGEAMDAAGDTLPEHGMGNDAMELEARVREMAGQEIVRKNGWFEVVNG